MKTRATYGPRVGDPWFKPFLFDYRMIYWKMRSISSPLNVSLRFFIILEMFKTLANIVTLQTFMGRL